MAASKALDRSIPCVLTLLASLLAVGTSHAGSESPCIDAHGALDKARDLRWLGALSDAREVAERALACDATRTEQRVELHLELARIHDRIALHRNSRPAERARVEIEAAEAILSQPSTRMRGSFELAKADYWYRAEMAERRFEKASRHAEEAIRLFGQTDDRARLADALHRLGLIHLQRGELDLARELFDRSLELDTEAGGRAFFHGDYHLHVGLVYRRSGDTASAVPHFRRSLAYRRQAGAVDASLFAAISLGAALVATGRADTASEPLLYALLVAGRLGSPVGTAHAAMALGSMYEKLGDRLAAESAYALARDAGRSVAMHGLAARADEAHRRLAPAPAVRAEAQTPEKP